MGLSGTFERLVRLIPPGIAAGLLAGILLQFGIAAFGGAKVDPIFVAVLFIAYAFLRRFTSRYAVVGILVLGLSYLLFNGKVDLHNIQLSLAAPIFVVPEISVKALLGVAF